MRDEPLTPDALAEDLPTVAAASQWSAADWDRLVREHNPALFRYSVTLVGHDYAADVCQETWLRAYRSRETFFGGRLRSWLFSIACNFVISRARSADNKLQTRMRSINQTNSDGENTTRDIALTVNRDEDERLDRLRHCLEGLDPEMRYLVQSLLGGSSYKDISESLQGTRQQAYKQLHTAKAVLKNCVDRDQI